MINFVPHKVSIMSYPLYLARKISFGADGKKSTPAVRVATAAVSLSVIIMIVSVSIVLGFKREIREKVRGFNSDITVYAQPHQTSETNLIELTPELKNAILSTPGVVSAELSISTPVIFKTTDDFKGVYMKNATSPQTLNFLAKNLERGYVPDFNENGNLEKILISRKTADQLGLDTASRIDTYFISDNVRIRRLEVAGIYDSHFDAYDDLMVYGSKDFLQEINGLPAESGTSVLVSTDDFQRLPETAAEVNRSLMKELTEGRSNQLYKIQTALEAGAGYFNWLSMLDVNVIVILSLMMAVGCVTLVSGMLIIILDKRRFIGTLKALGATTSKLRRIFVYLAIRIAISGLLIGDILAALFLWAQDKYHLIPLDPDSYYMDFVPVQISWGTFLAVNLGVLLVSYLVLILPSRFVARISPAETMRDEK